MNLVKQVCERDIDNTSLRLAYTRSRICRSFDSVHVTSRSDFRTGRSRDIKTRKKEDIKDIILNSKSDECTSRQIVAASGSVTSRFVNIHILQ